MFSLNAIRNFLKEISSNIFEVFWAYEYVTAVQKFINNTYFEAKLH